jgi:hypothetical protein
MCAAGARPRPGADFVGTVGVHRTPEGPHVGAVPPTAGIVTLPALRAHRFPYNVLNKTIQIEENILIINNHNANDYGCSRT